MRRILVTLAGVSVLALTLAAQVGAKEFGTVYVDGRAFRTFGTPARVDPGAGTDPIISLSNFTQGGVAKYAPGKGSHGGRWQVWVATWVNPSDAHLLTAFDDVLALVDQGAITLERAPDKDFRCPILPNG